MYGGGGAWAGMIGWLLFCTGNDTVIGLTRLELTDDTVALCACEYSC